MLLKFYLADQQRDGTPVNKNHLDYIRTKLAYIAGGYTEYLAKGAYINSEGELQRESTAVIELYTDRVNDVLALAKVYKEKCNQESALVVTDGGPVFL